MSSDHFIQVLWWEVYFAESVAPNTPSKMMPKICDRTGNKSLIVKLIERFYSL